MLLLLLFCHQKIISSSVMIMMVAMVIAIIITTAHVIRCQPHNHIGVRNLIFAIQAVQAGIISIIIAGSNITTAIVITIVTTLSPPST